MVKKKEFTGKQIKPPCNIDKCKYHCTEKIGTERRHELFNNFWNIGNLQNQRNYLLHCMRSIDSPHPYVRARRKLNQAYYFTTHGQKIRVCKKFLMATLDIGDRFLRTVLIKNQNGIIETDQRGKHANHSRLPADIKKSVRDHIDFIPKIESHYLRSQTTRVYIEGGKSLADLYRDYKSDREKIGLPFAKQSYYSYVFNYEYNISFYSPKKDQCELCTQYKNVGDESLDLKDDYENHIMEKELSRIDKSEDKSRADNDENVIVAVYDLQAILPVPKGDVATFYYKSKINCFNFTIVDINQSSDVTHCYVWNECEGNRGVNEIASCVFDYIERVSTAHDSDDLEIIFYSDNCSGQQKNRFMIAMYLYAVQTWKVKSITHKFLVRGHTQNEGDNCHSLIEKSVKRALKSGPICVPADYTRIIQSARKTGNPFIVHELEHDFFTDIKKMSYDMGFSLENVLQEHDIFFKDIRLVKLVKSTPHILYIKSSYCEEHFYEVDLRPKPVRTRKRLKVTLADCSDTIQRHKAYEKKIPVSLRKKKDIESLFTANLLPKSYKPIYDALFNS